MHNKILIMLAYFYKNLNNNNKIEKFIIIIIFNFPIICRRLSHAIPVKSYKFYTNDHIYQIFLSLMYHMLNRKTKPQWAVPKGITENANEWLMGSY
jgi:hypothetical protein